MQKIGDLLHQEPLTQEQRETTAHVLDVALAYQRGEVTLAGVREICSGYERWQSMRYADPKSEGYAALVFLVNKLSEDDANVIITRHGTINAEERFSGSVKTTTNAAGVRVLVWPMCFINGEPQYPPVHLPHGEERRTIEEAILAHYNLYRKEKNRGGERGHDRYRD